MRTCPGSRRGTVSPPAEPSPSPIRRGARSPPAHGPRLLLPSIRWLVRGRGAPPPSRGDPACGIGRTLRRPLALSPRRVGALRVQAAGMGRRMRPPVPVRARVPVLARDRGSVRVGEAEGGAPAAGPDSAGPAEPTAGARLPRVSRGLPARRGPVRKGLRGRRVPSRPRAATVQSGVTLPAVPGAQLPASARPPSEVQSPSLEARTGTPSEEASTHETADNGIEPQERSVPHASMGSNDARRAGTCEGPPHRPRSRSPARPNRAEEGARAEPLRSRRVRAPADAIRSRRGPPQRWRPRSRRGGPKKEGPGGGRGPTPTGGPPPGKTKKGPPPKTRHTRPLRAHPGGGTAPQQTTGR